MANHLDHLPQGIRTKLASLQQEIDQIISASQALLKTQLPNPIAFQFQNSTPRDVLADYERAQAISFVTRFEHLPEECIVQIAKHDGRFYIENMPDLRHALHEYRPVICNERDSVHYQKIHTTWYRMLVLEDPREGTMIRVRDTAQNDVTPIFTRWLCEHNNAITQVMRPLDYDYLYNGILQHSDAQYSHRFLDDYTSGELNYVLWKHVHVLGFIRKMLAAYTQLISFLARPMPGAL